MTRKSKLSMATDLPAIIPSREMFAYEILAARERAAERRFSARLVQENLLPSELLGAQGELEIDGDPLKDKVQEILGGITTSFSISIFRDLQYPEQLRQVRHALPLFYFRGNYGLLNTRCVSVVGARKASEMGLRRARKLGTALAKHGFTVVSGLARGVDTAAMAAAIQAGGSVVAVIGTPIDQVYPKENADFQEFIAQNHLLLSEVPFVRYATEHWTMRRLYFPARNETMSALSEATVIVEASDTSGTLTQARAALKQGRKLFILDSCFENPAITWPHRYEEKGAIRLHSAEQLLGNLGTGDRANPAVG
jgi:DNA processing protein